MGAHTKIEWADDTWNPVIGCQAVSPACDHCYAERLAKRFGIQWGPHGERRRTSTANWHKPLVWDRQAAQAGVQRRVFSASLADFFDNAWPIDVLADALDVVRRTPHLTWLILTKRPQRIMAALDAALRDVNLRQAGKEHFQWLRAWLAGAPPPHVWLGTTVENQLEAQRRIPRLEAVPAALRFLSCEPLLGRLDLTPPLSRGTIGWVIAGGESGPKARPSHAEWFQDLRDQCQAAGVPFFFKQWGEFFPENQPTSVPGEDWSRGVHLPNAGFAFRVGKKAAGASLDGREWREVPA